MSLGQNYDEKQILAKLAKDFHELVSNKETFRNSVEEFLYNSIDELTLGVIFDIHRKFKTKTLDSRMEEDEDYDEPTNELILLQHDLKKTQDCLCPNCNRNVAATRFASHLEGCMGLGRGCSRSSTRRMASNSKERENPSYSGAGSEDEDDKDDKDWNSGHKRGKKKKRNGSKKSKGTVRKLTDRKYRSEGTINHIGGAQDDDVLLAFKQFLSDNSNRVSPVESISSIHSDGSIRKNKEKSKHKRFRSSSSISID